MVCFFFACFCHHRIQLDAFEINQLRYSSSTTDFSPPVMATKRLPCTNGVHVAIHTWLGKKTVRFFYQKVPREAPNIQPRSAQDQRKNRESSRDSGEKVARNICVTIHHFSTVVFNKSFVLSLSLDLTPHKIGKSRYSILLRKLPVGRIWAGRIHVHQSSR